MNSNLLEGSFPKKGTVLSMTIFYVLFSVSLLSLMGCADTSNTKILMETGIDYPVYGGNKAGNRYSPLKQINKDNVKNLEVAWMYNAADPLGENGRANQIQCQPIVVDGILYGTTPDLNLFAVKAGTGEEIWKFSPASEDQKFNINTNRGISYWENSDDSYDKRILYTVGSRLLAVNIKDGKLVESFGEQGVVDLRKDLLPEKYTLESIVVNATSPGVVYRNTFVLGSSVSESGQAAPGHIRAFDILTGKLKWKFNTIPQPGEPGYETWPKDAWKEIGGANSWSGVSLDEERGVVYLGTGSPSSDFYGGNREGKNLFGNSILALDAETGGLEWYYQTIHHDLWDRDLPSPPNLTTINKNGKMIDVVVQTTKDGLIYVLDRDTGESLFPVEELPVPTKGLPGETPWPTQKFPTKPLPLSRQVFTEEDITDISPESYAYVKEIFEKYPTPHKFTPPNEKGTLAFGYSGGAEWGGNSIDPDGILYQNSNDEPWVLEMVDTTEQNERFKTLTNGNALYLKNCAACHGADRKGSGSEFPSLENIANKLNRSDINSIMETGIGRMPSFQYIPEKDRQAITDYLLDLESVNEPPHPDVETTESKSNNDDFKFGFNPRYVVKSWKKLVDQDGYPGVKPPWGTLNAIDLKTGDYLWRVPLGEYPELTERGIPITGTDSYGGPVVTAGGLLFIAGTRDEKIRAFDKDTGEVVWEYQLPAGGFATPITYMVEGKQYIVIAAGGARGQKPGGNYVAFSLSDGNEDRAL